MTNACTNSETNGAWPDLLRVAAMNRHCVARPRGRKTTELCFSPRLAHVREEGERRIDLIRSRDCWDVGEGVRREKTSTGIYGIGKEKSSTTRTPGDTPAQKRQLGLGRAGSRCYLRDAARCTHTTGHEATRYTLMRVCTHARTVN